MYQYCARLFFRSWLTLVQSFIEISFGFISKIRFLKMFILSMIIIFHTFFHDDKNCSGDGYRLRYDSDYCSELATHWMFGSKALRFRFRLDFCFLSLLMQNRTDLKLGTDECIEVSTRWKNSTWTSQIRSFIEIGGLDFSQDENYFFNFVRW